MADSKNLKTDDVKIILEAMIREISWKQLKELISSRSDLKDIFAKGSFQLISKNRNRVENILIENCFDTDCQYLFLAWYSRKNKYRQILEQYFESDKYKKWSKTKKIKDGEYGLPETLFKIFLKLLKAKDALFFLHFSPIKFTNDQAKSLIYHAAYSIDSPNDLHSYKEISPLLSSKELQDLRSKLKELKESHKILERNKREIQAKNWHLDKENKKYKEINERIAEKLRGLQTEMDLKIQEAAAKVNEKLNRCNETKIRAEKEIRILKEQSRQNQLILENRAGEISNIKKKLEKYKDDEEKHFHSILEKIDVNEIISTINEPDEVKESLSAVRPPKSDEPVVDSEETVDLKTFWLNAIREEEKLLEKITSIKAGAVVNGTYFEQWGSHADEFVDLKHSLRARIVLINMLYEILRQNFLSKDKEKSL